MNGINYDIYLNNKTKDMLNKMKSFESYINEESKETVSTEDKYKVADKLYECYQEAIGEAKEWADDVHDDHTVESYMKENAALVAALVTTALKESKDHTPEQFEASVNVIKDSFSKKLNEVLEMEGEEAIEPKKTEEDED